MNLVVDIFAEILYILGKINSIIQISEQGISLDPIPVKLDICKIGKIVMSSEARNLINELIL